MEKAITLHCISCNRSYTPQEAEYSCPECRARGFHGTLDVRYDPEALKAQVTRQDLAFNTNYTMWRFLPFLPVEDIRTIQPLKTGCTPLYNAHRLAERLRLHRVYVKDEGRNPTGSFKDRVSAVGIAKALEKKFPGVACASTGNTAASVACFAASAGLPAAILVPEGTAAPKLAQTCLYGARVATLQASYHEAVDLSIELCVRHGWYNLSSVNPYLVEGQKTIAYEICEQMGFEAPDRVFVPVADGMAIYGIYKGFRDFLEMGFIDRIPQLVGIQSEHSCPIVDQFEGRPPTPCSPTIADSIVSTHPTHCEQALEAILTTGGQMLRVGDNEILESMRTLASTTGVFGEPAAAAALAGLIQMANRGELEDDERVVVVASGVGLKDIMSATKASCSIIRVAPGSPDLDSIFQIGEN